MTLWRTARSPSSRLRLAPPAALRSANGRSPAATARAGSDGTVGTVGTIGTVAAGTLEAEKGAGAVGGGVGFARVVGVLVRVGGMGAASVVGALGVVSLIGVVGALPGDLHAAPPAATAAPAAHSTPATPVTPAAPGAAVPPRAPAGQDYAVRLNRTAAVGLKRLVVGSVESDDKSSGGAASTQMREQHDTVISYVVATKVLEVSPEGNPRRVEVTVRRLNKTSAGVTVELAKPGETYTASLQGRQRVVDLNGTPIAADLQEALATAAGLRNDDDPNDDDLFGTRDRQRVGASWPANTALFAHTGAQQVTFDPRGVSGTVTLAAERQVKGVPCLVVQWKITAHQGSFKAGSMPGGLLGTMTTMTITGSTTVPVDPALPPVARESTIAGSGDFTGITVDGDQLTVHRELRQVLHLEMSRLP